jgi:DNA repair protein RadA/Sms
MPKTRVVHRCRECGATAPRWLGRCPDCGEWGTLEEEAAAPVAPVTPLAGERPLRLVDVDPLGAARRPTGLPELDRVLGGGFVAGSVTLLGGEPGMGKSTLLLQALASMCEHGATALLVTAEESTEQVRLRAARLGAAPPSLYVVAETSLPVVLAHVDELQPDVVAVDSVQTVVDPDLPGVAGSVGQVRDCAARLVRLAKERDVVTVLVGHVTKDGSLAGPRVLEHVVDTVLAFEGDRHHALRMLHALKHRFGATDELGLFEMTERGLLGVADPSALFLTDRRVESSGSVVAPVLEGARPLLVEVQALVATTGAPLPRRTAQGLDGNRLSLLLAVLQQRVGLGDLSQRDVWASIAGGVRVAETGVDLAAALAVASTYLGRAVPSDLVAVGEVGLGGEIRQVGQTARRLSEAARLGFARAIVPASVPPVAGIDIVAVRDVGEALAATGLGS